MGIVAIMFMFLMRFLIVVFYRFYTKYVSEVESDPVGDFTRCRIALEDLGMQNVSDEDCSSLRLVFNEG